MHPALTSSIRRVALGAVIAATAVGCATGGAASPAVSSAPASSAPASSAPTTPEPGTAAAPVALTVGLGYIPSVQFAPFYLAQQAGYYAEAGLEVTFQNKIDPDLVTLVAQGSIDIGSADGTSVIPAVSQGIPVVYVATSYAQYPSIVFAKASAGIATAADLKGKKIGIPGRYGSSWIMLQALLESAGLTPNDVEIVEYPDYGQGAALAQGAIDAATGFANNEPVQAQLAGTEVVVLHVDDVQPLPGPGLVAGAATLAAKGDAIRAFIAATLRAMDEIVVDPQVGLDAATAVVPELATDPATQLAILEATIATWQSPYTTEHGLGAIDPAAWESTIAYLTKLGLVPNAVTVGEVTDGSYLPAR